MLEHRGTVVTHEQLRHGSRHGSRSSTSNAAQCAISVTPRSASRQHSSGPTSELSSLVAASAHRTTCVSLPRPARVALRRFTPQVLLFSDLGERLHVTSSSADPDEGRIGRVTEDSRDTSIVRARLMATVGSRWTRSLAQVQRANASGTDGGARTGRPSPTGEHATEAGHPRGCDRLIETATEADLTGPRPSTGISRLSVQADFASDILHRRQGAGDRES